MYTTRRAFFELHIAVLLFGFTAILGDLIQLPAVTIVWWRVFLTCVSLVALVPVMRVFWRLPRRLLRVYMIIGVLVAMHWVTFYGAIKLSNASVTLICMATASFFTAILEPIIMKQRIRGLQLVFGLGVIPAMALIVRGISPDMWWGVPVGLLSSFLAALFATLNKRYVNDAPVLDITFIELFSATIVLSFVLPVFYAQNDVVFFPKGIDWLYMAVLVLLCTTLAYVLALRALKAVSAFAANLTINMEPVYGILLAVVLLKEHHELGSQFYIGVVLITLLVFGYPVANRLRTSSKTPGG